MIRVVLDTVIFVRALINPRSHWGRIVFDDSDRYTLVISEPIVLEYLEVMRRPELVALFSTLPGRDPAQILAILDAADTVEVTDILSVSRDPKDDMFFATAKLGNAEYLVSEDKDQLVVQEYDGIQVIDGRTFLQILRRGE